MLHVVKAVACVVQERALLCFRHPHAGNQIPKGTVETGEHLLAAARRELHEESGIDFGGQLEAIGVLERIVGGGPNEDGPTEKHLWHLFLMRTTDLPANWTHVASGSPVEDGLVFDFFWQALDAPANGFAEIFLRTIACVRGELDRRRAGTSA